jgi:serine protease Do
VTEDLNFTMAQDMKLDITRGAAVKTVVAGSPAAKAGIKKGDIIVAIAKKPVRGHADYVARVSTTPVGRSLELELVSSQGRRNVTLAVSDIVIPPTVEKPAMALTSLNGLTLGAMLPGFAPFGQVQGARVLSVGDVIAKSGLQPDDVITKVDMSIVRSPQDVFDTVANKMNRYRLEVYRGGKTLWLWAGATS